MTTYYTFTPTQAAPFSFTPTLDGQQYSAVVKWNLFGQRWYIQISDLQGNLIFNLPVLGSSGAINLSSLSWANGVATVQTSIQHGFKVGQPTDIVVQGCSPTDYNGTVQALPVDPYTLTYPIQNPVLGEQQTFGTVEWIINMAAGYFVDSTLVYRTENGQFEVTP